MLIYLQSLRGFASGKDYVDLFKVQVVLMFEFLDSVEEFNQINSPEEKVSSFFYSIMFTIVFASQLLKSYLLIF